MDRSKDRRFFESLVEDTEVQYGADGAPSVDVDEYGLTHDQDINKLKQGIADSSRINERYTLKNELGAGGFATVYRAWDENLQRDVAVKIMRPELLQAEHRESFLKRFEREALLVARLDHNHLAPVYETGLLTHKGQDTAFIVMKYLEGQDLSDVLRDEQLSIDRTLEIINQTLEALAYIHSEGVVHKDLKPSNIFLCQDHLGRDHTYLMDFGIAHDTQDEQGRLTNTGVLTGTFQYMPPEYVLMHQATPSVDVFQMGLIITEALTGVALIHRNTTLPALVARYLRRDPLDLPPELAESPAGAVIARALALDVEDRYADARELFVAFSALTSADFPAPTPDLVSSAERHSEQLLSDPGVLPQHTLPTHAGIPSAIDDEGPRRAGVTDVADLDELAGILPVAPPLAAPTELAAPSPEQNHTSLYVTGVLLAFGILAAIGAIAMLKPPAEPDLARVTPAVAADAAATTSPDEAATRENVAEPAAGPDVKPSPTAPDVRPDDVATTTPPTDPTLAATQDPPVKTAPVKKAPVKKKPTRKKPIKKKPRSDPKPEKTTPPVEKKKPRVTLPPEL